MILDENQKPLVPVHVCWDDHEADIIVSVLLDGGIEAVLNSEVPHSVLPIKTAGLGKVEVLVREAELAEAERVIRSHKDAASA